MKVNFAILGGGAMLIGALVYVLAHGFGHDPHEVPFLLTGKPAPAFTLPSIDGKETLTLKDKLDKPVVLNFWSSWCVPCKAEHPVLEWGHEKLGNDVHFIGVVYQDNLKNVSEYLQKMPSGYTQLFDELGRVSVDYGLAGVPETYFITKSGQIQYKHVGPLDRDGLLARVNNLMRDK